MTHQRRTEKLNIYMMYNINDHKTGFKIIRDSWASIYAIVKTIGGQSEGKLKGPYPYYLGQDVVVDLYKNNGTIEEEDFVLSCPGTYAYRWVREKSSYEKKGKEITAEEIKTSKYKEDPGSECPLCNKGLFEEEEGINVVVKCPRCGFECAIENLE